MKSEARMIDAVDRAVAFYEEPPTEDTAVETSWDEVELSAADWDQAFAAPEPGTPHNEARAEIREELLAILVDKHDPDVPTEALRRELSADRELMGMLDRAWPLLDPGDVVGDLWEVPAYLRLCAPWLDEQERRRLRRGGPQAWTAPDLPLLDAARRRLGDAGSERRRRRQDAAVAARRQRMADVVDDLVAGDDSDMLTMSMLRGSDLDAVLVDDAVGDDALRDPLAGPFAHVVVDEAQELTDAQWRMVLARCPSRSLTVVGDRAQARGGFAESWEERLARVGLTAVRAASLTVNYRTPEEVMAAAEPVIRAVLPDANVPTSIRRGGAPVEYRPAAERDAILDAWLAEHDQGTACVLGDPTYPGIDRVRSLSPVEAKGLEFDLVLLAEPAPSGDPVTDAVDRYVAMTRATQRLVILERR
ncbi:hypothetical protein [Saccharomonospora sp. CUA-673]|uniref:hypothetical protein n=1 Tax=Saccharomonospora sp. CUA-673 TaxID=1904969 RepID=UPI001C9E85F0|nr:hypothetical protein [Saccharomonospora sp. CUA-673]